MTNKTVTTTNRDVQRVMFIDSLHTSMKKKASKAIVEHKRFLSLASSYLQDGLEADESIELLMIDGLNREAAEGYVAEASGNGAIDIDEGLAEYSFQFEDSYGRIYTSFDIGKTVLAENDDDAWFKAEEITSTLPNVEAEKIISVYRIG